VKLGFSSAVMVPFACVQHGLVVSLSVPEQGIDNSVQAYATYP
jgi:hypothetical protein